MLGQASAGPSLRALTLTIWEKVLSASCTRSRCLRSRSACRLSASGCSGCKCSVADTRTFSYSRDPLGSSPLTVVTVLWNECGPRVTSSCQEPCAASCRYETMEPSPSQSCSLGSRKRERTPGHPSVSALGDTLPVQSPGSPRTHPIQPTQGTGERGQITQLTALSREAQMGHPCCPGGEGHGYLCHRSPPFEWTTPLWAHTEDPVMRPLHPSRFHLPSSPPGHLHSTVLIAVLT